MKWKDRVATKKEIPYQAPHYKEDEWWLMDDIRKEVKKRTGRYIHPSVVGKIAKEKKLFKYQNSIKLYHKSVVDFAVKYIEEYYHV